MKLFRSFVGYRVVFPFQDTVGGGVLSAVSRDGWILVENAQIDGVDAGDMILALPEWMRRVA